MARQQKLKVFRTPIGFHDAYVAAPSQKAALEAWGSDKNLFVAGGAERVEDPELMREPLANPGKVIRRLRGTAAEQFAALPRNKPRKAKPVAPAGVDKSAKAARQARSPPPPKPKPRPDRAPLQEAQAALAEAEQRYRKQSAELARRQAELDRERRELERGQARERDKLARRLEVVREKYERATRAWRAE